MTVEPKIYTLGRVSIQQDNAPIAGFISRKVEALFIYLACNPHEHPRETLATLLWEDLPQQRAMANLRMALSNLKDVLDSHLIVTRYTLGINPAAPLWLDAAELEKGLAVIKQRETRSNGPGLSSSSAQALEDALALYHGNFLAGFNLNNCRSFEEWVALEQERFQVRVVTAYHFLINDSLTSKRYTAGVAQATRLLQIDPLSEEAHRQLMMLFAASDQRSAALAQYASCRQLLSDELGVEPSEATTDLYQSITRGAYAVSSVAPVPPPIVPTYNLPRQATPFIDRPDEIARIGAQLDDPACRLLTLVGPGGVGKTRLALHIASERLTRFKDGVYFVPIAALDSSDFLAPAILSALNVASGTDPVETLVNYLHDKETLLAIDNFEHMLDSAPLLSDLLAKAPALKILVTSRERLNLSDEWLVPIDGMAVPQSAEPIAEGYSAVQLFAQSARRREGSFSLAQSRSDVVRICQLVEGLPLGIELAAAWIHVMSCAEIATRIEQDLDFLSASTRNIPERHRSIRLVFDDTCKLLTQAERIALARLALFPGAFDRPAAVRIAGVSLSILSSLVEKSLVRREASGRYAIHELLKRYAYEMLVDAGLLDQTKATYCSYFVTHVEALDPSHMAEQWDYYVQLDLEYSNIRQALEWLAEAHETNLLLRISSALVSYWRQRGYIAEGRRWLASALQLSDEHTPPALRGQAMKAAGILAWNQSDFEVARRQLEASVAALRPLKDFTNIHEALKYLGYLSQNQGDYAGARGCFEEMLALARQQNDAGMTADAIFGLGGLELENGDFTNAIHHFQECLPIFRALGSKDRVAITLSNVGTAVLKQDNYSLAQAYFEEAISITRELGMKPALATTLLNLGEALLKQKHYTQSHAAHVESLQLFNDLGDKLAIIFTLESFACLLSKEDQAQGTAILFGAAEAVRQSLGAPIPPRERMYYDSALALAADQLGGTVFARDYGYGSSMTLDQAVVYALQTSG